MPGREAIGWCLMVDHYYRFKRGDRVSERIRAWVHSRPGRGAGEVGPGNNLPIPNVGTKAK